MNALETLPQGALSVDGPRVLSLECWGFVSAQAMQERHGEVTGKVETLGSLEEASLMHEDLTNLIAWGHVRPLSQG